MKLVRRISTHGAVAVVATALLATVARPARRARPMEASTPPSTATEG